MEQYKIQMVDKYTGEVLEDFIDDLIFDDEDEAEEHACYKNSCSAQGAEIMRLRDPFGYDDDLQPDDSFEYIAVEIDD